MKISSILFIITIFSFMLACNENTPEEQARKDIMNEFTEELTTEDKVFKAVESLPEFKEAAEQISAMTNGEQSISIIIEEPTEDRKEYYLQAGYNKDSWFETYYHFYVDPETFEITVEDIIVGDRVSLETWRERNETR